MDTIGGEPHMKSILLAALLLVQSQSGTAPASPDSRLHPQNSGPYSFDFNLAPRSAFETVGEKAGLTVVIDRDLRPAVPTISWKVQDDPDIAHVLDELCKATSTFWVPIGAHSIFISESNPTKHRDYDLARFKLVRLSGPRTLLELNDLTNALRQGANVTSPTPFPRLNMLMWRDTPEKSAAADKKLAELSAQMFGASATVDTVATYERDASGNVYLLDGSGRNINPKRTGIQTSNAGIFSLDINQPTRSAMESIAAKAGLTVMFQRDLRPIPPTLTLKLKDVDVFEALDILTIATRTFWVPLDAHTIYVVDDNTTMRRDYDLTVADIVRVSGTRTTAELNDVMNLLRQNLNITTMTAYPATNVLLMRDSPEKVALAEEIIADLDAQISGNKKVVGHVAAFETNAMGNIEVLDAGSRLADPLLKKLQPTSTGPFSFDISQASKDALEAIAVRAGLTVVFDRDFRPTPPTLALKINDNDVYSALDKAALQLRAFWLPLGNRSIFVTDNNSTKRRDFEQLAVELIDIPGLQTAQELNDVMNAVRQNLNLATIYAFPSTNSLLLRDTPAKVELAKAVIAALRPPNSIPAFTTVTSIETDSLTSFGITSNTGLKMYASPASAQIRPKLTGTFSLHINDDARHAYEVLGETVGLNVNFAPKFTSGSSAAFNLENVDVLKALEQLGTQTGNSWQVVDSQTIFITPDKVSSARPYEATVLKSFQLSHAPKSDLTPITTAIRLLFSVNEIMTDDASNTIELRATPTQLVLIEKLLTALDRPSAARSTTP